MLKKSTSPRVLVKENNCDGCLTPLAVEAEYICSQLFCLPLNIRRINAQNVLIRIASNNYFYFNS